MKGPLSGTRVVELGTYVAAPALGSILGMLGAEVVKVEPPSGDPTRSLTPWSWVNYNWNKKCVVLDLKSSTGIASMRQLLKSADVFIESLSPRAVRELGLSFAKTRRINPRIIHCSIKGFGSDSASSQRVGFDTIAQAEGGLMYVAKSEGGNPSRVGNPCVDLSAATFGAVGVLSAMVSPGSSEQAQTSYPIRPNFYIRFVVKIDSPSQVTATSVLNFADMGPQQER